MQQSSSSSFFTSTGSKTVTYSTNIHSKKHKTHKSENKSSKSHYQQAYLAALSTSWRFVTFHDDEHDSGTDGD